VLWLAGGGQHRDLASLRERVALPLIGAGFGFPGLPESVGTRLPTA
jgi:hypothetical protein